MESKLLNTFKEAAQHIGQNRPEKKMQMDVAINLSVTPYYPVGLNLAILVKDNADLFDKDEILRIMRVIAAHGTDCYCPVLG